MPKFLKFGILIVWNVSRIRTDDIDTLKQEGFDIAIQQLVDKVKTDGKVIFTRSMKDGEREQITLILEGNAPITPTDNEN